MVLLRLACVLVLSLLALYPFASQAASGTTPKTEVKQLPGYGPPPTKTYSGFVETDSNSKTHLFYYLVESQSDPKSDPLFLWMNGKHPKHLARRRKIATLSDL